MSAYIGTGPTFGTFDKQLITGDGSTATFTLDFPVAQAGQILVSLDGIIQEPSFSYNISLSTGSPKITFASAPSNGSSGASAKMYNSSTSSDINSSATSYEYGHLVHNASSVSAGHNVGYHYTSDAEL